MNPPEPPPPPTPPEITRQQAIDLLWRDGDLSYLLRPVQQDIRQAIAATDRRIFVIECSRRLGKTFVACVLAIEHAIQKPRSLIRFVAPTKDALKRITAPIFTEILEHCPADLRPTWVSSEFAWQFANGSTIYLAGANAENADNLRGNATHLAIVDEAAFIDDLNYLVQDILLPPVQERRGRLIIISTPPKTPAHHFLGYVRRAVLSGAYFKRTIMDASHITDRERQEWCEEAGGPTSTTWRREYLCEHITDAEKAVLPEFGDAKPDIVVPADVVAQNRPRHFIPIVVGDIGFHDLTFVVFGYHDFKRAVDVIEGEVVVNNTVASEITRLVEAKARALWGDDRYRLGGRPPRTQFGGYVPACGISHYADAPPMVVRELGDHWSAVPKSRRAGDAGSTYMQAAVNDLRTRIRNRQVLISDACPKLIAHLEYAIWDSSGRDFLRQGEYGHFDGVSATAYFTRLVDRTSNPYPWLEGVTRTNTWIENEGPPSVTENLKLSARTNLKQKKTGK